MNTYSEKCDTIDKYNKHSECEVMLVESYRKMGDINIYDIYRHCFHPPKKDNETEAGDDTMKHYMRWKDIHGVRGGGYDPDMPGCADDSGAYRWLNMESTRTGLHIWANASVAPDHKWHACAPKFHYEGNKNVSYWIYPKMIAKGYRIWVYSGDTDGAVPTEDTLAWMRMLIKELNLTPVKPYSQWTIPGRHPK